MRAFLAMLVVLCVWTGPAAAQGADDLSAGLKLVQAGKCREARERLTAALGSQWLTQQQVGVARLLRGLCNIVLEDNTAARADLDRAVQLLDNAGTALYLRADLAWRTGDKEQSLKDVLRLAREFPGDLKNIDLSLIWRQWRWLKDEGRSGDQFTLLEAVVKADYQPKDPGQRADGLVQEYIGMLIEKGKVDQALPLVKRIISTDYLLEMRVDGRFKPLWANPEFEAYSKPLDAAKRERKYGEAAAKEHPESLKLALYRMQILRTLGESESAIKLGESVVKNFKAYEDDKEYRLWVLNELAYALMDMGRTKDADAWLKPLLKHSIEKAPYLVNQFINYGAVLNRLEMPERALEAVAKVTSGVTPYGKKWIDSVKVCANVQLGRSADAEAALARLKTKPEENYAALSRGLLCLGRIDEAAKLTVKRLRDPDNGEAMLMALQTYRQHQPVSSFDREMWKRLAILRKRPGVVAEAQKHGRLLKIPLFPTYWGDY